MYMVQTEEQYIFIHDAVLDAAQSGSTEVPASKLKQHIETNIHAITQVSFRVFARYQLLIFFQGKSTGLDVEFQSLVALRPPNATFHVATQPINIAKNRQPDQLPYDSNRVILQMQNNAEGTDFINGSWVDSYQVSIKMYSIIFFGIFSFVALTLLHKPQCPTPSSIFGECFGKLTHALLSC